MNQGCNFQKLQLFTKYLGQTLDFMCNSALQEKFNFSSLEDFFQWGSFRNRDDVRASIQFRRESQPHHLKR